MFGWIRNVDLVRSDLDFFVVDEPAFHDGNKVHVEEFDFGYLKTPYKNGRRHGETVGYYNSGQMWKRANYEDGLAHGRYQEWRKDGSILYDVHYKWGASMGPMSGGISPPN